MSATYEKIEIADEEFVIRQMHYNVFSRKNRKRYPNESHFIHHGDGLSVNWEQYCNIVQTFVIIGLSYKYNTTNYKNPRDFIAFKFKVEILRKLDGISDVLHDPIVHEPEIIGTPNNYGHSLVKFPEDPEIRVKLCEMVELNYENLKCEVEFELIENKIQELKNRL